MTGRHESFSDLSCCVAPALLHRHVFIISNVIVILCSCFTVVSILDLFQLSISSTSIPADCKVFDLPTSVLALFFSTLELFVWSRDS